ncbi:small RNA-binding protein 11, chloroplastic-like isoform X5 [Tripterygium wilfordii]|uniref:small RNA-binding protein 11, chloroplastic-like isoform X5 n=1 Tax=Tripterygium wilfordii TaxID=458696 RepID=UPI0018F84B10|nr:small RNA-binding protein 11, chloroplastic-like isoform X5 [Tripterygium wilfordii]
MVISVYPVRDVLQSLFSAVTSRFLLKLQASSILSSTVFIFPAKIVMDRVSGKSKGFGFVSFASEDEAQKAITEMDGKALNGRVIFVDIAKPKTSGGGGMPIARGPPE